MNLSERVSTSSDIIMAIFHSGELAALDMVDPTSNPYQKDRIACLIWEYGFSGLPLANLLEILGAEPASSWVVLELDGYYVFFDIRGGTTTKVIHQTN